ncbi:MAG: hypothetical protein ABS938_14795 [Psychrobacillus psychrodurans]
MMRWKEWIIESKIFSIIVKGALFATRDHLVSKLDVAIDFSYIYPLVERKEIYGKPKGTIERVFADAKEKHGMRWTT